MRLKEYPYRSSLWILLLNRSTALGSLENNSGRSDLAHLLNIRQSAVTRDDTRKGAMGVNRLRRFQLIYLLACATGLIAFTGCTTAESVRRPTLNEVRLGKGQLQGDTILRPGEIRAEVLEVDPARRQIRVRMDGGRTRALTYDLNGTRVVYHEWEYSVADLEAGDIIAFQTRPRGSNHVDTIRVQEPVQARVGSPIAPPPPAPPRPQVIEGTVERIDYDLGVFDLRPRAGRMITVAIPYNARASDVESFRRLRRGDYVRLEGEFVNPDSFQLLAFLPDFDRSQSRR